jgi:hypothetical protein
MPHFNPSLSTDANLSAFGLSFVLAGNGFADVVDAKGIVLFTGTAFQVNDWLRDGARRPDCRAPRCVGGTAAPGRICPVCRGDGHV